MNIYDQMRSVRRQPIKQKQLSPEGEVRAKKILENLSRKSTDSDSVDNHVLDLEIE